MTMTLWAAEIARIMLMGSAFLVLIRAVIGPSVADRAVALDMLSVLAVGFAALTAILTGQDAFLDVAVILALVGFLATLSFARFIVRRGAGTKGRPQ